MDRARRPHQARDLRPRGGKATARRRARARAAGLSPRRLTAPQGAQERWARDRRAGGQPADLPGGAGRARRPADTARTVLDHSSFELQGHRRGSDEGGRMSTQAQQTAIRSEIVVDAPQARAFELFAEKFDKVKPREHNMLGVDIAESVFEPRAGGRVYDRGVDGR